MTATDNFYRKLTEAQAGLKLPRVITSGQGAYLTIDGRPRTDHQSLVGEESFGLVIFNEFDVLHGRGSVRRLTNE